VRAVSRPTSLRRIRLLVQSRCCVSHLRPFDPQSSRRAASHPLTAPVGSPKQALRRSRLRPCRLRRRADPSGPAAPRARAGPKPAPAASPTHAVLLRACRSPPRQRARRQPPHFPPPHPAARAEPVLRLTSPAVRPPVLSPRRQSSSHRTRRQPKAGASPPLAAATLPLAPPCRPPPARRLPAPAPVQSQHPLRPPRAPSSSASTAPRHVSVRAVSRPAALRHNRLLVAVPVLHPARPQPFCPRVLSPRRCASASHTRRQAKAGASPLPAATLSLALPRRSRLLRPGNSPRLRRFKPAAAAPPTHAVLLRACRSLRRSSSHRTRRQAKAGASPLAAATLPLAPPCRHLRPGGSPRLRRCKRQTRAPAATPTHAVFLRACRSPPRQRARRQPPRCPPPQPAARGSAGAASHAPSRSAPESSRRAIVPPLAAPVGSPKQALRRRSQLRPCRLRRRADPFGPAAPRACAGASGHPLRRPRTPSSSTRAAPQHASVRAVSRPAALRRNRLLVAVPVLRPTRVPGRSAPESSCRAAVRPLATPTGKPKQTLRRSRLRPCRLRRRAALSGPAALRACAGSSRHPLRRPRTPVSSARAAPCAVPPLTAPAGKPKHTLRRSRLRPCRLRRRADVSGPAAPRACAGASGYPLRRPRTPSFSARAAPRHASVRAVSRPAALRRNRLLVAVPVLHLTPPAAVLPPSPLAAPSFLLSPHPPASQSRRFAAARSCDPAACAAVPPSPARRLLAPAPV
jgi:hypothetical protein